MLIPDLYRAHPDQALHVDGLTPLEGQRVLDIARPEVADYLFHALDAVLRDNAIAYLKWDMNRMLTHPGRAGAPVAQAQVSALYALLARLRAAHPGVEIKVTRPAAGGTTMAYWPTPTTSGCPTITTGMTAWR